MYIYDSLRVATSAVQCLSRFSPEEPRGLGSRGKAQSCVHHPKWPFSNLKSIEEFTFCSKCVPPTKPNKLSTTEPIKSASVLVTTDEPSAAARS